MAAIDYPIEKKKNDSFKAQLQKGVNETVSERAQAFAEFLEGIKADGCTYGRLITSPTDREVVIRDPYTGKSRKMLMFASNNYLGYANHPYVKKKVKEAIDQYGVGLGGPPLLNGYTKLMQELEERLAALKHQEAAMIFPAGYSANVGLITALVKAHDKVIFDLLSHASFLDGLRMAGAASEGFEHNNLDHLKQLLDSARGQHKNLFVGVEGVYSMDGDIARLDSIVELCQKYDAILLLDDAHGTGVLGENGSGTAEEFGCSQDVDITMGTFSKAFAATGGFLAGDSRLIDYIRFFARPYMFSAALPPVGLAAVLAGIDLIEDAPELRYQLLENAQYAATKLEPFGLVVEPAAAIIAVKIPAWINIRRLNYALHKMGIFLNSIEYPAVPMNEQRIRISITTNHTRQDIDYLADCLATAWRDKACQGGLKKVT